MTYKECKSIEDVLKEYNDLKEHGHGFKKYELREYLDLIIKFREEKRSEKMNSIQPAPGTDALSHDNKVIKKIKDLKKELKENAGVKGKKPDTSFVYILCRNSVDDHGVDRYKLKAFFDEQVASDYKASLEKEGGWYSIEKVQIHDMM